MYEFKSGVFPAVVRPSPVEFSDIFGELVTVL